MNEQTEFPASLEERAAAAARAVRAEASARPMPVFDPARVPAPASATRFTRRPALLAAAAVLALLVGAVAWIALRSADEDTRPTTTTGGEPRGFLAEDPPAGLKLAGAGEVSKADAAHSDEAPVPLDLYGPTESDPRLGITVVPDGGEDGVDDGTPIDVGGRPGRVYRDQGLGSLAVGVIVDGRMLMALSSTLDQAELAEILAETTVGDDSPVVGVGALPEGWRRLGSEPSLIALVSPVAAGRASVGASRLAYYVASDPSAPMSTFATVQSLSGDALALNAPRVVLTQVEEIDVRGHRGLIGRLRYPSGIDGSDPVDSWMVTWIETPGELVRMTAVGLDRDQAIAFARSLGPVEGDRWRQVVEDTQLGAYENDDSAGQVVGEGRFDDGTRWRLMATAASDGSGLALDLKVALPGGSSSAFSGSATELTGSIDRAFPFWQTVEIAGRTFAVGRLGDGVASVEAIANDGTGVAAPDLVEGAGVRAVVTEFTGRPVTLVAKSADGADLAHWVLTMETDQATEVTPSPSPTTSGG